MKLFLLLICQKGTKCEESACLCEPVALREPINKKHSVHPTLQMKYINLRYNPLHKKVLN